MDIHSQIFSGLRTQFFTATFSVFFIRASYGAAAITKCISMEATCEHAIRVLSYIILSGRIRRNSCTKRVWPTQESEVPHYTHQQRGDMNLREALSLSLEVVSPVRCDSEKLIKQGPYWVRHVDMKTYSLNRHWVTVWGGWGGSQGCRKGGLHWAPGMH